MTDKIYLGKVNETIEQNQSYNPKQDSLFILGEDLYIKKHNWDCDWYWGFGYIGNEDIHTHASVFIHELIWHNKDQVFEKSIFNTNDQFWIFKDLLKQAYSLQETAEIYQYGGHCITDKQTEIIKSKTKAETLNQDLEKVLNQLWKLLERLESQ